MFKHKKIATKKISKPFSKTIKIKNIDPIASPLKTTFNIKDMLDIN